MTVTTDSVFRCELGLSCSLDSILIELFERYDQTFSRFRDDSELNFVNGRAGSPTRTSSLFAEALEVALDAAVETDGVVDPTLGRSLTTLGYDRDLALLEQPDDAFAKIMPIGAYLGRYRDLRFDPVERIVWLPGTSSSTSTASSKRSRSITLSA